MTRSDATSSPRHDGSRLVLSALLWVSVAVTFVTALAALPWVWSLPALLLCGIAT
jgi:hypothetical protein